MFVCLLGINMIEINNQIICYEFFQDCLNVVSYNCPCSLKKQCSVQLIEKIRYPIFFKNT